MSALLPRWEVIHLTAHRCRPAPSFRPALSNGVTCPKLDNRRRPTSSPRSRRTTSTSDFKNFRPPSSSYKVSLLICRISLAASLTKTNAGWPPRGLVRLPSSTELLYYMRNFLFLYNVRSEILTNEHLFALIGIQLEGEFSFYII